MIDWFTLDSEDLIEMLVTNHEITAFVYFVDDYMTVVEGIKILRNSSEFRQKYVWATLDVHLTTGGFWSQSRL